MSVQAAFCESCGMPLYKREDHGLRDFNNPRCKYCTNPDGTYKSYEEVFEGTVQALMQGMIPTFGKLSRQEAEEKAQYLKTLPAWKKK